MALGVIDTLSFYGDRPSVVEVASGIYAIAYETGYSNEWLITVSIDPSGNIGDTVIDSFNFYTGDGSSGHYCGKPSLIHITGDIYAIAYEDVERDGNLVTVEIDSEGNITESIIDSLEFFDAGIFQAFPGNLNPHIIHVSGDIYAIVYWDLPGTPSYGWLITVDIDSVGNITDPVVDSYRFDATYARSPYILNISGTTYAIAYIGNGMAATLKTVTIGNDGSIAADPLLDTLVSETFFCLSSTVVHISGDIYAIAYESGWLATVDIDSEGNIEDAVVDSYEFDEVLSYEPHIIKLTSGLFAIAYRGTDNDGFVITIAIADNGTIGAISDTLEYDTSSGHRPCVFDISLDIFAIAYGSTGRLKTIGKTPTVTTQAVSAITPTTATGNGNITDLGTPNPTAHGVCWNTTGSPTLADDKTDEGAASETGAFTTDMTELVPGTEYYVRAYATGAGTSYGSEVTFVAEFIYPTDAQTRVTSLIHRYDRGTYTLEVGLGEVVADFGLPEWDSKPRRAYPEATFQERMDETARQLQEEADMTREESLRIARKLETLEDIERRERGVTPPTKAVPTREEFWSAYPGVPYPYGEQGTTTPSPPSIGPKPAVTPEEERELIKLLGIQLWNKLKGQQ